MLILVVFYHTDGQSWWNYSGVSLWTLRIRHLRAPGLSSAVPNSRCLDGFTISGILTFDSYHVERGMISPGFRVCFNSYVGVFEHVIYPARLFKIQNADEPVDSEGFFQDFQTNPWNLRQSDVTVEILPTFIDHFLLMSHFRMGHVQPREIARNDPGKPIWQLNIAVIAGSEIQHLQIVFLCFVLLFSIDSSSFSMVHGCAWCPAISTFCFPGWSGTAWSWERGGSRGAVRVWRRSSNVLVHMIK